MSYFQKRLLISGSIGAIMFILTALMPSSLWLGIERPILASRNFLNVFKIFSPNKSVLVLNIDQRSTRMMNSNLSSTVNFDAVFLKDFFQGIIRNLDAENVSSITIAINNISGNLISALNLQAGLTDVYAPIDIVTQDFKVDDLKKKDSKTYILDKSGTSYRQASLADFLSGKITPSDLQGKAIVIRSELDSKTIKDINSVINYSAGNWLPYYKFHPAFGFLLLACAGVLFASTVLRARALVLGLGVAAVLIIGQLMYCFGAYLETVPVIFALIISFALSLLLDTELQIPAMPQMPAMPAMPQLANIPMPNLDKAFAAAKNLQEKCSELINSVSSSVQKSQGFEQRIKLPDLPPMPNIPLPQMPKLELPIRPNISPALDMQDLRNKVYKELEYSLDLLSKDFQERTVAPLSSIQAQLDELMNNVQLDVTNQTKLELLRYDFDKIISELDTLLFTMVPFQFEGNRGIIDPLEIYARKITEIYRGKPRIYLSPNAAYVQLTSEEKANLFRIVQRLVESIIDENGKHSSLTHINIDVMHRGDQLTIKMTYDGLPLSDAKPNAKLREIARRAEAIGLKLDLGFNWGEEQQAHLVNRIQLSMQVAEHEALTQIFPAR